MYRSSDEQHPRLNDLSSAVRGIVTPFLVSGTRRLTAPVSIQFPDGGSFLVRPSRGHFDQEKANEPLRARCKPATSGRGRKGKNRGPSRAYSIDPRDAPFSVAGLDLAAEGILEEIRAALAPMDPEPITAELVALHLHDTDDRSPPLPAASSAAPGRQILGSLVVCLPSSFSAGQVVVVYRGAHRVFDWGQEIDDDSSPQRARWIAILDGATPSSERLWSGSRVMLTYLLRRGPNALSLLGAPSSDALVEQAFDNALADKTFLRDGGTLAFPCLHGYLDEPRFQEPLAPFSARSTSALQGRDRAVARAALARGLAVELQPYLVETSSERRWPLSRFPSPDELNRLRLRMSEQDLFDMLPIQHPSDGRGEVSWVISPPTFNWTPCFYGNDEDGNPRPANPDLPALELLCSCDFTDLSGEESETEFHVYAALKVALGKAGERATTAPDELSEPDLSAEKPAKSRVVKKASTKKIKADEPPQESPEPSPPSKPEKKTKTASPKVTKATPAAASVKESSAKESPAPEKKTARKAKAKPEQEPEAEPSKADKSGVKKWNWSF